MATEVLNKPRFSPRKLHPIAPGDEIVISGIAGRFPDSDNVRHLQENLMNKVDMITDDDRRWNLEHPLIPKRTGKLNNLSKFDSLFFGVHIKQGNSMDPMARLLLEHSYEAIVDAGINPKWIRHSRTGIFIGTCISESEKIWMEESKMFEGYGISGTSRAMYANRISYAMGFTGPSHTIDTACSSSCTAFDVAYRAICDGVCDAALVGGCNLCLDPIVSLHFFKLGVLSADGRCKSFDEKANGYARSETVGIIFLQKQKDARRIYAHVIHSKANCDGFKEEGIMFPSTYMQTLLLKEFYAECGVDPKTVKYMEAHGTGTHIGDPEEVNAINAVLIPGRTEPLLIGSVKSNLGHSEGGSGMCSIAKTIVALETGLVPPNLHYETPRKALKPIIEGAMKVVTEPTPWDCTLAGINSFGFGGANVHILLKANQKTKINNGWPDDNLTRLVVASGRTELAVTTILDELESKPCDVEFVKLLHDMHADEFSNHLYRGYTLLPPKGVVETPIREVQPFSGLARPIVFVFSGMGSQWPGMGEALLQLPVFYESIKKCDAALKPHGIDIFHIITNKDKSAFDKILNSFVGIAAIQVGLVDVLKTIGIEPNYIIGHSVGELGCAYADGCFTAEQMVLCAYSRGKASQETETVFGSMAAVGLGYRKVKDLCPPDIEVACHNSADSSTISGPAESMKAFVAELQDQNIFAREVPCSNIPYHSRYIAPAGPKLLKYLKKIITDPKPRSKKWLSTSVPINKWDNPSSRYSSAEYHTNNLLSSVLFEETALLLPKDAVAIEIAPHGLLQAILRRSLSRNITNIPLTQRGHKDNLQYLLSSIGKMFMAGLYPQIANLYPPIEYPVSRGTPMISPLIKWEHSVDWYVSSFKVDHTNIRSDKDFEISLRFDEDKFYAGHLIDGRNLFPATGYLLLVWQFFGKMNNVMYDELPVVFEDIKFLRATTLTANVVYNFRVVIQTGTGRFEVKEAGAPVASGYIRLCNNYNAEIIENEPDTTKDEEEVLSTRDIYKEFRLRGYQYNGMFRSMKSATLSGSKGHITWQNDWCAYMDNMLQIQLLTEDTRALFVPTAMKKIVIDPKHHKSLIPPDEKKFDIPVYTDKIFGTISSGGIQMRGLQVNTISRRKPTGDPVLESYEFIPYIDDIDYNLRDILRIAVHICLENMRTLKVKTFELLDENDEVPIDHLLSPLISDCCGDLPLIQPDVNIITTKTFDEDDIPSNITIINPQDVKADASAVIAIGHRLLTEDREKNLSSLLLEIKQGGFLISREDAEELKNIEKMALSKDLITVLIKKSGEEALVLLKKQESIPEQITVINVNNNEFSWVDKMRDILKEEAEKKEKEPSRILFVGQGDYENGLTGLVNCLRQEPGGEIIHGILIQDPQAPEFSLQHPMYLQQIQKDLTMSVLRGKGCWGSYRHLLLAPVKSKLAEHALVIQSTRGDLSSVKWVEGPFNPSDEDIIDVHYATLNFKDVMIASGRIPVEIFIKDRREQEFALGFEISGINKSGKKRMGFRQSRALSNLAKEEPDLTFDIPENWTLEDAATIPCVYATCIAALYIQGHMKRGDKVLIHAGTGGVGQAAINLCHFEGCEIFTTVGTPEKRRFIRENFPFIDDDHIGNSRDTSFETMVMRQTNGRGVDLVLNSLAEEKLQASVRCLAIGGRFLEIGKFDLVNNSILGMDAFMREIVFQAILLDTFFSKPKEEKIRLRELMKDGIRKGAIKPIVRTVFPKDKLEAAFRYMAAGKHIGKVVMKLRDEKDTNSLIPAEPRFNSSSQGSYIILGGLGGFGLELVDWLVIRGAKNIVITSRTGIKAGYQRLRINLWESYGVRIVVVSGKDSSKLEDCQHVLQTAAELGPVDAIFNLAVVLKDALWENQTPEMFEELFRCKAWTTKNLDVLSRKMCPKLRHFVVFSSVSCGRGNAGQTNYGMSNSVMERICERRVADGLPGLAIQWGAVGDVGLVAEMQEDHKEMVIGGTLQQRIFSCLQMLDVLLHQNRPVVSSMVVAEKRFGTGETMTVVGAVLNIMSLKDLKGVSLSTSLAELGMDSMMGVEIKQTLEREFDIFLTAQDIRTLNFAKLQELSDKHGGKMVESDDQANGETTGINILLRVIGNDDLNPETCLKLPSREEPESGDVFMIPGLEGVATIFTTLAQNLKSTVNCLQLGIKNNAHTSITEMASYLVPYILEKTKSEFVITGYSYGALIAIEIVRQLEAKGLKGRLILIDGAADQLKEILRAEIGQSDMSEFENKLLFNIFNSGDAEISPEMVAELHKCGDWEEKIETCAKYAPQYSQISLSLDNQKALCSAVYKRLRALQNYDISGLEPIKTPIQLIKPTLPSLRFDSEDYNLSKVTEGKVDVYYALGNHLTLLDDIKVAKIINGDPINEWS